jgi:hypothetical protein
MPQVNDFFQQQRQWAEAAQKIGQRLWQSATEIAQLNAKSFGNSLPIFSAWTQDTAASSQPGTGPTDAAGATSTLDAGAYWRQLFSILDRTQADIGRLVTEQSGTQLAQTLVKAQTPVRQQPWFPKAGAETPMA